MMPGWVKNHRDRRYCCWLFAFQRCLERANGGCHRWMHFLRDFSSKSIDEFDWQDHPLELIQSRKEVHLHY